MKYEETKSSPRRKKGLCSPYTVDIGPGHGILRAGLVDPFVASKKKSRGRNNHKSDLLQQLPKERLCATQLRHCSVKDLNCRVTREE